MCVFFLTVTFDPLSILFPPIFITLISTNYTPSFYKNQKFDLNILGYLCVRLLSVISICSTKLIYLLKYFDYRVDPLLRVF